MNLRVLAVAGNLVCSALACHRAPDATSSTRCEAVDGVGLRFKRADAGAGINAAKLSADLGARPGLRAFDVGSEVVVVLWGAGTESHGQVVQTARARGLDFAIEDLVHVADDCTLRWPKR